MPVTPTPSDAADFLVVGGGIGGLVAALCLARQGRHVLVLEQAPQFGEIGAGLQLAPNASRILDSLGLLDQVNKDAFFPQRLVLMDAITGAPIYALRTGEKFLTRYGYPYLVTHRADLHAILVAACRADRRIDLAPGKQVVEVGDRDDLVEATCHDDTSYRAAALIGADGIRSTIRAMLIDDGEPASTGYVAYRGTVSVDAVREAMGVDELTDMVIWIGPGLHLVQYPVRRGELCNQVAVFRSSIFDSGADTWGTPEELDSVFARTCTHVASAARLMNRERSWPMIDRPPQAGWTRGRVALLGDAAHPMFQYLAQGACQAMEDAVALADAVAGSSDIAVALDAYEKARFPRASTVQRRARMFGEVLHAAGTMAGMRNYFLSGRSEDDCSDVDWLYGQHALAR